MWFFFNILMLKKFLIEVIVGIVGKPGEDLVALLDDKKYTNEFLIAKKLDLTINQTRNILYKISDYGLVSSIRKKDKKKGWYTYFWKIETLKSLEFLKEILLKNINRINKQIESRKEKQFYICKRCNIEITEEKALPHNFICNECGEVYSMKDNSLVLRSLEKEKNKLDKQLSLINEEIQGEKAKLEKSKTRRLKKEEKEKAEKRKIKRELTRKKKREEMEKLTKKKTNIKKSKVKGKIKQKIMKAGKKKVSSKKAHRFPRNDPKRASVYTKKVREPLRGPKARNAGAKK